MTGEIEQEPELTSEQRWRLKAKDTPEYKARKVRNMRAMRARQKAQAEAAATTNEGAVNGDHR